MCIVSNIHAICNFIALKEDRASLVAQMVKNTPALWETWVRSLGWEDPVEEGTATHSRIFPWRIPTDREWVLAGYTPWGHKESDMTE